MITGQRIVATARGWMGTPWVHQASLKGIGCDCVGLIAGVAGELGLPEAEAWKRDVRYIGYGRLPLPDKLLEACAVYLNAIPVAKAGVGDILLFTFLKEPMHFGIISAENPQYIIHAYSPVKHVCEHILDGRWSRRVLGAFRFKGVD